MEAAIPGAWLAASPPQNSAGGAHPVVPLLLGNVGHERDGNPAAKEHVCERVM